MKYNYIEDVVNRTVDELHTCDPFEIAKKLNIEIIYEPVHSNGLTVFMPNKILIFIDKKLKKDISRYFVLSHELGHAILHQNCNNRCDRKNMDKEADFFATSLLMKYTNIQVTT